VSQAPLFSADAFWLNETPLIDWGRQYRPANFPQKDLCDYRGRPKPAIFLDPQQNALHKIPALNHATT
jgi:hypothetical protein